MRPVRRALEPPKRKLERAFSRTHRAAEKRGFRCPPLRGFRPDEAPIAKSDSKARAQHWPVGARLRDFLWKAASVGCFAAHGQSVLRETLPARSPKQAKRSQPAAQVAAQPAPLHCLGHRHSKPAPEARLTTKIGDLETQHHFPFASHAPGAFLTGRGRRHRTRSTPDGDGGPTPKA